MKKIGLWVSLVVITVFTFDVYAELSCKDLFSKNFTLELSGKRAFLQAKKDIDIQITFTRLRLIDVMDSAGFRLPLSINPRFQEVLSQLGRAQQAFKEQPTEQSRRRLYDTLGELDGLVLELMGLIENPPTFIKEAVANNKKIRLQIQTLDEGMSLNDSIRYAFLKAISRMYWVDSGISLDMFNQASTNYNQVVMDRERLKIAVKLHPEWGELSEFEIRMLLRNKQNELADIETRAKSFEHLPEDIKLLVTQLVTSRTTISKEDVTQLFVGTSKTGVNLDLLGLVINSKVLPFFRDRPEAFFSTTLRIVFQGNEKILMTAETLRKIELLREEMSLLEVLL